MAEKISKHLLLALIIFAIVISVLSITLSIVALCQDQGIGSEQQQGDVLEEFGGTTSVEVPPAPSTEGAMTTIEVS